MSISIEIPIRLTRPMIGFDGLSAFALVWGNHALFDLREYDPDAPWAMVLTGPQAVRSRRRSTFLLRSNQVADLGFLGISADLLVPDYLRHVRAELPADLAVDLELDALDDALAIALIGKNRHSQCIEANLLAPVVVNVRRRLAAQVILTECGLPVHAEVL